MNAYGLMSPLWSQNGVLAAAPAVCPPTSVTMLLLVGELVATSACSRNTARSIRGSTAALHGKLEGAHA